MPNITTTHAITYTNTFYRTVHRAEKKINKGRTDKFTTKALSSKGQI